MTYTASRLTGERRASLMLNSCVIMGRFTAEPELRKTTSGTSCCSFTLAVEREGKPDESGKHATDFIDCVAWRSTAEFICKYFSKGRMAVAEGRMQTRTWKDKHDQSRKNTELRADSVYFADSKRDGGGAAQAEYAPGASAFSELTDDDGDLPF